MPWWTTYLGLFMSAFSIFTFLALVVDTPLNASFRERLEHAIFMFLSCFMFGVGIQILVESIPKGS